MRGHGWLRILERVKIAESDPRLPLLTLYTNGGWGGWASGTSIRSKSEHKVRELYNYNILEP